MLGLRIRRRSSGRRSICTLLPSYHLLPSLLFLPTIQRLKSVDWFEGLFTDLETKVEEVGVSCVCHGVHSPACPLLNVATLDLTPC